MLQVARLAPKLLHEAADSLVAFFHDQTHPDGGTRNRAGDSDLYYTVFGLDGLIALQAEPDADRTAAYLERFGDGEDLDLVHLACLARCQAAIGHRGASDERRRRILERVERHRSLDGGYAGEPGAAQGTAYHAFLAVGAREDVGLAAGGAPPDAERAPLARGLAAVRSDDGGYANAPGQTAGTTPTSAAAVTLLHHLGERPPAVVRDWLLARAHPRGGFVATGASPVPDLLSTATALHALSCFEDFPEQVREPCLDFLDTLWTGRGFCGHWADDEPDAEYTFYGLLALGHLAV